MPDKLPKDELQRSSSRDRTAPAARQESVSSVAVADEVSVEQLEEFFIQARQTVEPIIRREAENKIANEDILFFANRRYRPLYAYEAIGLHRSP